MVIGPVVDRDLPGFQQTVLCGSDPDVLDVQDYFWSFFCNFEVGFERGSTLAKVRW